MSPRPPITYRAAIRELKKARARGHLVEVRAMATQIKNAPAVPTFNGLMRVASPKGQPLGFQRKPSKSDDPAWRNRNHTPISMTVEITAADGTVSVAVAPAEAGPAFADAQRRPEVLAARLLCDGQMLMEWKRP